MPGVLLATLKVFGDKRGSFAETYRKNAFAEHGVVLEFVQDNQSISSQHVLRGLHYQLRHPQAKLVRVVSGTVYDVVVDIRRNSPTFGRHQGFVLSDEVPQTLYIPPGFAHGLYVMSPTVILNYKCSDYYHPEDEGGIAWNDPGLGIEWPIPVGVQPVLSEKDGKYRNLADLPESDLPSYN